MLNIGVDTNKKVLVLIVIRLKTNTFAVCRGGGIRTRDPLLPKQMR